MSISQTLFGGSTFERKEKKFFFQIINSATLTVIALAALMWAQTELAKKAWCPSFTFSYCCRLSPAHTVTTSLFL